MIENIPTWSFEPNWSNPLTEGFDWLTDVLTSPSGAEQRRTLRVFPRKTIEFSGTVQGAERSTLDDFLMRHSGRNFYLPMWHESYRSIETASAGDTTISVPYADNGGIKVGDVLFIGGDDARHFELATVAAIAPGAINLVVGLAKDHEAFSKIHPVRKARFSDQPNIRRISDRSVSFTATFRIMQRNDDVPPNAESMLSDTYKGFPVISVAPDESDALDTSVERILDELDNQVGIPIYNDISGFGFVRQKHAWVFRTRRNYGRFLKMAYDLRGRAKPTWLPTFSEDMAMVSDTPANEQFLTIENTGFVAAGAEHEGRRHLCIFMLDGTRIYREIISGTLNPDGHEIIGLSQAFPAGLKAADVLRISFMQVCRLDQDRLEISHMTDSQGVSKCGMTFRAAPDLRKVTAGF